MSDKNYSLSDFDYHLPQSLIAQQPVTPRDHSRLLVYNRKDGSITDDLFVNLPGYLPEQSALVLNNSRVEKARLLFGKKEVFVTRIIDPHTVEALIRPGKSFRKGQSVTLAPLSGSLHSDSAGYTPHQKTASLQNKAMTEGRQISETSAQQPEIRAEVLHVSDDGQRTLRFNYPVDDPVFENYRRTPFPPYIRPDEKLSERYQTIYARDDGSRAAPTAGLHFTDRVFSGLSRKSIEKVELTLHVGLGTFAPVKTESIKDHIMHSEWYRITPRAAEKLSKASHITAVGTTSARVLESVAAHSAASAATPSARHGTSPFRNFSACEGETDIFITPGYHFQAIDALVTNFHLPKSTLLMMIAAFTGIDEMHRIYRHAIAQKYRFYSFGDAMLLL